MCNQMRPRACANCGVNIWVTSSKQIHCKRCEKRIAAKRANIKATKNLDRLAHSEALKRGL